MTRVGSAEDVKSDADASAPELASPSASAALIVALPAENAPLALGEEPRSPSDFAKVGHEALFGPQEARCDACDGALVSEDDEEGGHGLYVWSRHGEVFYEEPPLCASCAAAITITALQRWEIEEEEG